MKAAARNARISIERPDITVDNLGDETEDGPPMPIGEAFAQVRFGASSERRTAAQEGNAQAATFAVLMGATMASVTVKDRIVWEGTWNITGIAPSLDLRDHIEFTAVRSA